MELAAVEPEVEAAETLRHYYQTLHQRLGPQGWWPARTRLEVILGAILTQNTAWANAALAVRQLRKAGLLNLARLHKASQSELEHCIRPAGFYRHKALTIRNFLGRLTSAYAGSLTTLFAAPAEEARRELLKVRGLGPETVDAILLYAGRHPFFVADAYARRILVRHALVPAKAGYSAVQQFLHRHLPPDQTLFNEFHALLVEVGKRFCRRGEPDCEACPLKVFLPHPSFLGAGLHGPAVSVAHSEVP
jgi:endonuclease-3 related protein